MHIVLTTHGTKTYSGIAKYSYLLAIALAKKGIDTTVIVDSTEGKDKLYELCQGDTKVKVVIITPHVNGFLSTILYSLNVSKYLLAHNDFDILHTNHVTPFFYLTKKNRKPVMFQPFGNELFTLSGKGINPVYCRFAQPILYFCGNRAETLVSEGEFQHKDMIRWYDKPENELRVLPVGVDIQAMPVKQDYTRQATIKFLAVSSLFKYEGMYLLINALKQAYKVNSNIALTIVGSGSLEGKLKRMSNGHPIQFLKELPELELKKVYQEADVFVCTSEQTDYQMGILEAMATGLPLLSTPREWLPPEAVQVSPDKLGNSMVEMATWTTKKATKVGKAMCQTAKQHDFDTIADKAIKIYEELL